MTIEVGPVGGSPVPTVALVGADGGRRTEFEIIAALEILGVPMEASARFGPGIDTILQARFGDKSLGEIIEYLVHRAEPSFDFKLNPPWDLLNKINLKNFVFQVDLTNGRVGFQYNDIGFEFPLISLNRIEIWYAPRGKAGRKSVDVSLYGSFLGKDYNTPPGLTWDVLSQPPPAVPGKGTKYFDLEYLGLGQRVTLRDRQNLLSMKSIIDALEESYADVDPSANPLDTLTSLQFDSASSWLIGTKFTVLESATLSVIFNDPNLYGLRVALEGKRVGKLAGLEFEIVYKRINDHLGLYHFELKLPDVIRKIQLGQVNITLPIIDIDIYTNGNFKIDLGFPANLDFSRSAAISFIVWVGPIPVPITGSAGLYFGVLSSETSTQVPAITNGEFAPVLVAGFGMRLGLGYSIQIGILDAGFFVGFVGLFEGVLAFFQPDSPSTGKAVFFKVSATVGIMGHIWGTVNFAILKASVDICAYATAQLVIEIHQPIEVVFEAGVSVKLRVKILFIHITLSFSAHIRKSFTMGSQTPTRWQLASSQDRNAGAASMQGLRQTPRGLVADELYTAVLAEDYREHAARHARTLIDTAAGGAPTNRILLSLQPMFSAGLTADRPPSLAEAPPLIVANATSEVLNAGVDVNVAGRPYTTVDHDTFAKIATATGATLAEVAAGVGATAGLLTAGATLAVPQGAGSHTIAASDTVDSLLATLPGAALQVQELAMLFIGSHGSMWEALAVANGDAAGVIEPDVEITIGSNHYTTKAGDTFDTVAAAFDVTVPVLADNVRDNTQLLHPGATLAAPTGTVPLVDGGLTVPPDDGSLFSISQLLLSPFEQLARLAFVWAVENLERIKQHVGGPTGEDDQQVTRSDLNAIWTHLTDDDAPLQLPTIVDLLTAQSVQFVIGALPPDPDNPQFAVFPMLPYLTATVQGTTVDYSTEPFASSDEYRKFISAYFAQLAAPPQPDPSGANGGTNDGGAAPAGGVPATPTPDSITADLFTDFYVVILRQILQDAIDLYEEYRYTPTDPQQTLAEIAAQFGLVDQTLAEINADVPGLVAPGHSVGPDHASTVEVGAEHTLGTIATQAGTSVNEVADSIAARRVLQPGARMRLVDGRTYTVQPGDTLSRVAAERQVAVTPEVAVARIATANQATKGFFELGQELAIVEAATAVESGETLADTAARLQTTPYLVALAVKDEVGFLTVGGAITIVGAVYVTPDDATIGGVVADLGVDAATVYGVLGAEAGLLHPWVGIHFQGADGPVDYRTHPNDTLGSIAAGYGIDVGDLCGQLAGVACLLVPGVTIAFDVPLTYAVRPAGSGTQAESPQHIAETFGVQLATVISEPGNAAALELTPAFPIVFGLVAQVRSGDSLDAFAGRYGLTPTAVGTSARVQVGLLTPGTELTIDGGSYVIRAGDSLNSIAARFNTSTTQLVAANGDVDPCFPPPPGKPPWSPTLSAPLPVGYRIKLPAVEYAVAANDTLQGIADAFSVDLASVLTTANTGVAGLLATQAAVALPRVVHTVAKDDTPSSIAQQYGLSVDRLVLVNQGPGVAFGPMIVPDCQRLPLAVLERELQEAGDFDAPSGSLARFMLHGLRLPTPAEIGDADLTAAGVESGEHDATELTLYPMYSVLGQQWAAPTTPTTQDAVQLGLNVAAVPQLVSFAGGGSTLDVPLSAGDVDVVTRLWAQLGSDPPIDPQLLSSTAMPPYVVVPKRFALGSPIPWSAPAPPALVHDASAACAEILPEALDADAPPSAGNPTIHPFSAALRQQIDASPGVWHDELAAANATVEGALAPGVTLRLPGGVTHETEAGDTLQSIADAHPPLTVPQLADAIADTPRLLVPGRVLEVPGHGARMVREGDTLSAVATATPPSLHLDLEVATRRSPSSPTETTPIDGFGWVTQVAFGLRRSPDPSRAGQFIPSVYEVFGTDEAAIHDLQQLLDFVRGPGAGDHVDLQILYPSDPSSSTGLRSDTVDPAAIWLLKANLSTRTNPPQGPAPMAMLAEADGDPSIVSTATLAPLEARDFLTLLWEANITNTGGYYLFYRTAGKDGTGLPDQIFGQDPLAQLTLLVTVKPDAQADTTIAVQRFHNAALITQNVAEVDPTILVAPPRCPIPADKATLTALADQLDVSVQALGTANATTGNMLVPGQTITVPNHDPYTVQIGDDLLSVALSLGSTLAVVVDTIKDVAGLLTVGAEIQLYPTWLTRSPQVAAGAAGFRLLRADPDPDAGDDEVRPEALTAQQESAATQLEVLFNLIGYRLTGQGDFDRSPQGLPAGPTTQQQGEPNHDRSATPVPPWTYVHQLAIAQFATTQPTGRAVPGQDPYAGVGADSIAQFGLQFQDTFGNRFLAGDGVVLDLPIRYHDELVGVANWPAVAAGFDFGGTSPEPVLNIRVDFDPARYVPASGDSYAWTAQTARGDQDRYREVYFQVVQTGVEFTARTTVDGELAHALPAAGFADFAATSYDYLGTVAAMQQVTTTTTDDTTMGAVAATWAVTAGEVASANRSCPDGDESCQDLLEVNAELQLRFLYSVVQNDTLARIVKRLPESWGTTDPVAVATRNPAAALTPGVTIAVGTSSTIAVGDTLGSIAGAHGRTAQQLAEVNADVAGLLTVGAVISFPATTTVATTSGDTLDSIAAANSPVTVDELVVANATLPRLLAAGVDLEVAGNPYETALGDTFEVIAKKTGAGLGDIATAAADVRELLLPQVGIAVPTAGSYTVADGDTIQSVADANQLSLAAVASAIAGVDGLMVAGAAITIPAAHQVAAGDTLAMIATVFGADSGALGAANSLTPGLLAPGARLVLPDGATAPIDHGATLQSVADGAGLLVSLLGEANADNAGLLIAGVPITVDHQPYTIEAGDTLGTIAAKLSTPEAELSVAALAQQIADQAPVLQPGAAAALPTGARAQVQAADTLGSIGDRHGIRPADVAATNASATTLLTAGAEVSAPYAATAGDSLAAVGHAFGLTIADLATPNATVANLYAPETALDLADKVYEIGVGDTFESIAAQEGISVSDIGVTNADAKVFVAGKALNIPRHVALGAETGNTYEVAAGDTLATVAAATSVGAGVLTVANQDLAGLIAEGVELTYTIQPSGQPVAFHVTTVANDTLSTATARLQALVDQWQEAAPNRPRITVSAADVGEQNEALAGLLVAGQRMLVPPAELTLAVPTPASVGADGADDGVTGNYPGVIFPVTAELTVSRPADEVDPRFGGDSTVASVTTALRPNIVPDAAQADATLTAIQMFAESFQDAYADLKLATGSEQGASPAGVTSQIRLFAVQNQTSAFHYDFDGDHPSFFSPPPLLNALWQSDGKIGIRPYVSGKGLGQPVPTAFSGIDLDTWGKDFLAAVDLALSADYAVAARSLDQSAYEQLVEAKDGLASAIRQAVVAILEPPAADEAQLAANLSAAQQALYQRLLIQLSEAYSVDTIVQLPVNVTAPEQWQPATAPRFLGQPTGATSLIPPGATLDDLASSFDAPLALFATVAASYPYIVRPGFVITGVDYETQPGDTVQSVADLYGSDPGAVAVAAADTQPLIAEGVKIPLPDGSDYTTVAGDSFGAIAGKLDMAPAALGAAAAAVAGLLLPDETMPGPAYTAQESDTLASLARHARRTVVDFATAERGVPALLQDNAALDLVRRTYDFAKDDTLQSAIGYLALATPDAAGQQRAIANFAAMNATVEGIFATTTGDAANPVVLTVPEPYQVQAGDTIDSIAGSAGVRPDDLGQAIQYRTDVLTVGAAIQVGPSTYTVRTGDSLALIAGLVGISLDQLVDAVGKDIELLVAGAVLALPGAANERTHTVEATDSLDSIAHAIASQDPPWDGVTPDWIVTTQLTRGGVTAEGATVAYLSRVPGFSLSDAKIELVDAGAHHASSLNILFSTASNVAFSNLALQLAYQVNQLEYDIEDVPWADGYQSSQWLGYICPFGGPPIDGPSNGAVDLPIPLRSYPVPPVMVGQTIVPWVATHTVAAGDTLAFVSGVVGRTALGSTPDLLAEGASLVVDRSRRHVVAEGDTLDGIAERYGADPTLVADHVGPLRAGAVVAVPTVHAVAAGDTLDGIAGRHGATAEQVIAHNADTPGLLRTGATVRQQTAPTLNDIREYCYEYSFDFLRAAQDTVETGWVTNIDDNGADVRAETDLITLPGALAQYTSVAGALTSDLARLTTVKPTIPGTITTNEQSPTQTLSELGSPVVASASYVASVNADAEGILQPGTEIPLAPPYTITSADTFASIAEQRDVTVADVGAAAADVADLFRTGVDVSLPLPGTEVPWIALRTFAAIANDVATGWNAWTAGPPMTAGSAVLRAEPPPAAADRPATDAVRMRLRSNVDVLGRRDVQFVPVDGEPDVHPAAALARLAGHLPAAGAIAADATAGGGSTTHVPVGSDGGQVSANTDRFTQPVPDLDVISTQNIWGHVSVKRNLVLIPTQETNPSFVYTVPDVRTSAKAVPLITYGEPFDMTSVVPIEGQLPLASWVAHFFAAFLGGYVVVDGDTLDSIAATFADADPPVDFDGVVTAFGDVPDVLVAGVQLAVPGKDAYTVQPGDTLSGIAGAQDVELQALGAANRALEGMLLAGVPVAVQPITRNIRIAVRYAFDLNDGGAPTDGGPAPIVTAVPVTLRPTFGFQSSVDLDPVVTGLTHDVAEVLASWQSENHLADDVGAWVFDVSLYTTLPTSTNRQLPPLLEMTDIVLRRNRIAPPG